MRIAVVTSLFPIPARPREGVFAERRWRLLAQRGHEVRVVHPIPWAPPAPLDRLMGAERLGLARAPRRQALGELEVVRPRYLHLPGRAPGNARRFARAAFAELDASGDLDPGSAADVVVCDYAWPAAAVAQAVVDRGRPVVIHGRGSDVLAVREDPALAALLAQGLRAAGHWCAVSSDLVTAMDRLAESPGRGRLTPNGVDSELFQPGPRPAARARLGATSDCPGGRLVLVVGHLIERKRPLLALEAFAMGAGPEDCLVFVGRGPLAGAVEAEARRRGMGDRVRCVGEADPERLADWYRAADLLLLTSSREGRPNVVLEALASGLGVVATDAGGTRELLDGTPGTLVESDDVGSVAAALGAALADPPGPQACRAAVGAYTWSAAIEALEGVLEAARREAR